MPDGAAAGMARPPATTADGCRTRASHGSSLVVPEAVPHAVDRLQVVRLARIGLELAAGVLHVRVDRALRRLETDAVDRVRQPPARQNPTVLPPAPRQQLQPRPPQPHTTPTR